MLRTGYSVIFLPRPSAAPSSSSLAVLLRRSVLLAARLRTVLEHHVLIVTCVGDTDEACLERVPQNSDETSCVVETDPLFLWRRSENHEQYLPFIIRFRRYFDDRYFQRWRFSFFDDQGFQPEFGKAGITSTDPWSRLLPKTETL